MATSALDLYNRTRRYLRDVRDFDALTVSLNNSTTTVTVADTSIYQKRWPIEIDQETMMVRSVASTTALTVERGAFGSTATSHANSAAVQIRPSFYSQEIFDALNEAIQVCFPLIYKPVIDTSLTVQTNQYQYAIPDTPGWTGYPIPYIYRLEILQPGDYTFRSTRRWIINRGFVTAGSPASSGSILSTQPTVQFKSLPPISATIRISGFGPFPALTDWTSSLDGLWPPQAIYLPPIYAAASLLQSGEAGRVRLTAGAVDSREQANRVGASMAAGSQLMNRFYIELQRSAMPPMPRHVKAVI